MKIYYVYGIDGNSGGNNYADVLSSYFYETEEEAKEQEKFLQGYGEETETGSFNGSKGWIVAWGTAHNDVVIEPMAEGKARKLCADWTTLSMALDVDDSGDDESRAFYFKKFTPESFCTTSVDTSSGKGFKWEFSAYNEKIKESVKVVTETKMKHIPTFESFINK